VPRIDPFEQHRELTRINLHAGAAIAARTRRKVPCSSRLLLVTQAEMLALRSLRRSLCS
jgi:hypothetical protein